MKERLTESFSFNKACIRPIKLTESNSILSVENKEYECRGAFTVPIGRPDIEGLNGRTYPRNIFEKNINEVKLMEGASGLMDHASDGSGTPANRFCIWHNIRIEESFKGYKNPLTVADMYLVGDFGQQTLEAINAGGNVFFSTTGMGSVEEGVVQDDFILESCDQVMSPSLGVGINKYSFLIDNESVTPKQTEFSESNNNIAKDLTIYKEKDLKIKEKEESKMDKATKILEKNVELNVKSILREASKEKDPKVKLEAMETALDLVQEIENEELLKSINEGLLSVHEELNVLVEKGTKSSELESEIKELKEALEKKDGELTDLSNIYEETLAEKEVTQKAVVMLSKKLKKTESEEVEATDETPEEVDSEKVEDSVEIVMEGKDKPKLSESEKRIRFLERQLKKSNDFIKEQAKVESKWSKQQESNALGLKKALRKPLTKPVVESIIFESKEVKKYFNELKEKTKVFGRLERKFSGFKTFEEASSFAQSYEDKILERKSRVSKKVVEKQVEVKKLDESSKEIQELSQRLRLKY